MGLFETILQGLHRAKTPLNIQKDQYFRLKNHSDSIKNEWAKLGWHQNLRETKR